MSMETHAQKRAHGLLKRALSERAQQLFLMTDLERKGFIVKRDMQRMRSEVPLAPEQLETVFDSLDVKGNGFLTIEQFLDGFGQYLSTHMSSNGVLSKKDASEDAYNGEDSGISLQTPEEEEEDEQIYILLQQLTVTGGLNNLDVLRQLCRRVQKEGSAQMQANLESFLQQLTHELKRRQRDHWELERTLRMREEEHNKQVQHLFEEMEAQLAEDKENLVRQEEEKLRLSRKSLEDELAHKNKLLHEILADHQDISEQLQSIRTREISIRNENTQLLRNKEELEFRFMQQCREVVRLRQNLEELHQNEKEEQKKNLSKGFRLARSVMLEQQGLLQQLQLVRGMVATLDDINTKMWQTSEEKSRLREVSLTSFDATSGVLDDYEYDEDFCSPVFERAELMRTLGTQTAFSHSSGTSSLQEELESSKSSSDCECSIPQKVS